MKGKQEIFKQEHEKGGKENSNSNGECKYMKPQTLSTASLISIWLDMVVLQKGFQQIDVAYRDEQFADNKKFKRNQGSNTILMFYIRNFLETKI